MPTFDLPFHPGGKTVLIETGFNAELLLDLANVVRQSPSYVLHSVDLSVTAMKKARSALERAGLEQFCTFHLQDPIRYLDRLSWADAVFLSAPIGLEQTIEEFRRAASVGAALIVISNFQSKAALAVDEALRLGWVVEFQDEFAVLTTGAFQLDRGNERSLRPV